MVIGISQDTHDDADNQGAGNSADDVQSNGFEDDHHKAPNPAITLPMKISAKNSQPMRLSQCLGLVMIFQSFLMKLGPLALI